MMLKKHFYALNNLQPKNIYRQKMLKRGKLTKTMLYLKISFL